MCGIVGLRRTHEAMPDDLGRRMPTRRSTRGPGSISRPRSTGGWREQVRRGGHRFR